MLETGECGCASVDIQDHVDIARGTGQPQSGMGGMQLHHQSADIDQTAAVWEPNGKGTVERLRQVAGQDRRPQDCELLDGYSVTVEAWTVKAAELLGDIPPTVSLRLPCPACGRRFYHRRNQAGENVRSWCLQISEDGCRCQVCRAAWLPEQFEFLAKLLGCPALPAA